jgi:hypothetical protein
MQWKVLNYFQGSGINIQSIKESPPSIGKTVDSQNTHFLAAFSVEIYFLNVVSFNQNCLRVFRQNPASGFENTSYY